MSRQANKDNVLARLRTERGITGKQLAAMTGIPHSTLSNVEAGYQTLSPQRVKDVAEVLAVNVEELEPVTGKRGLREIKLPKNMRANSATEERVTKAILAAKPQPTADEMEKVWLYMRQLNRRVMALEARAKEEER